MAWVAACASLLILFISRLHYSPKYLFFFDNANFAFAIRQFNPALHQPQPPGYPLFVALLKAIHWFTGDPNQSLVAAGIIGSAVALALLWLWTAQVFGRVPAYLSVALLLLHPVFWVAGVANPVRVFLAVITSATAWAAWETIRSERPSNAFYVTAAVLGVLSGFRPETLVLLAPLWLTVGIYRRLRPRTFLLGALILACAASVWLLPMAARMGGFAEVWRTFADYLRVNSIGFTAAYGAPVGQSAVTMRKTLIWTFGMIVAWVWVLPFIWKRFASAWDRPRILLIAAALVPPVLFHALVHVRDIDQTLVSIPVVCLVGGVALAAIPSRRALVGAAVFALLASYWTFRRPLFPEMNTASGSLLRYVNHTTIGTYDALDRIRSRQPGIVAIWDKAFVPWRNVSYYYSDLDLLVISDPHPFWVYRAERKVANTAPDGTLVLPPSTTQIVLGLSPAEAAKAERVWPGARLVGPLVCLSLNRGETVRVGAVVLRAAP